MAYGDALKTTRPLRFQCVAIDNNVRENDLAWNCISRHPGASHLKKKTLIIKGIIMESLRDVCYEQIADQYWYGLFGDFKLIIDRNTGYFNATKLCRQGGKNFSDWSRNKDSKTLIEYYRQKRPPGDLQGVTEIMIVVDGYGNEIYNRIISGTYLPEEIILGVATWISKDFYDKVYRITRSYCIRQFDERYIRDNHQFQETVQRMDSEMERLRLKNEQMERENERYRHFEEDIAFKTVDTEKLQAFALIKMNDATSEYPFYVIRTQKSNYDNTVRRLKRKHPHLEIILELPYNPNAVNLFNRIKEQQVENIRVHYNGIQLVNGCTEEQLVSAITEMANLNVSSMSE
ncbi:Putative KilA-N domain-containing protein 006L [Araneus ventricosus]|uniref:KilA-N domain-containing protein 006L n=1 Tax=Araneus ventricosus TaxID=182803 RepID=A0A4Y2LPJ1_ARAVE|nr:Putative KilA-N domain-containing protein 006L [Araneus ventricosus]